LSVTNRRPTNFCIPAIGISSANSNREGRKMLTEVSEVIFGREGCIFPGE